MRRLRNHNHAATAPSQDQTQAVPALETLAAVRARWSVTRRAMEEAQPDLMVGGGDNHSIEIVIELPAPSGPERRPRVFVIDPAGADSPVAELPVEASPPTWTEDPASNLLHAESPGLIALACSLESEGALRTAYLATSVFETLGVPGGRYEPIRVDPVVRGADARPRTLSSA